MYEHMTSMRICGNFTDSNECPTFEPGRYLASTSRVSRLGSRDRNFAKSGLFGRYTENVLENAF